MNALARWTVATLAAAGMLLCWAVLAGWRTGTLDLPGVLVTAQGSLVAALSLVLALRAWPDPRARRVAVGFLWIGLYWPANFGLAPLAYPLGLLCDVLQGIGMAALVIFAVSWDATPPRFVRAVVIAAVIGGALTAIVNLSGDLSHAPALALGTERAFFAGMIVLLVVALVVSLIYARGIQRRRIGWVTVSFSSAFVPWALYEVFALSTHISVIWNWVTIVDFAMPLGFGYALLRHRVLDLGFALNRAAVFAATTLLLAGLFGGLQWAVNGMLADATRREGFIAQLIVAVVVLYVMRIARSRTETIIAKAFFAKRRRRIEAIGTIARDLDALDDPGELAPFVVRRLYDAAEIAATVAFGEARVPVASEAAFPLLVRGRTRGVLLCRQPSEDEEFAPDERAALANLAHSIAIANDDLLAAALRYENAELRTRLALGGADALVRPGGPGGS